MKRYLNISLLLISMSVFFSCQSCGRDLGDVEIIQKDADWDDVLIFCDGDRALGLDPVSGERQILVRFPCIQLVPGSAVPGGGYAVFGWNTTEDPFNREAILVDDECRVVKTMECLQNAAYIDMVNEDQFLSDSLCFTPEGNTAYAFTSIASGKIVHKDMTLAYLRGNIHNFFYDGKFYLAVNGNEHNEKPAYILFRDMVDGIEQKEGAFFTDHPYDSFACEIFGNTLVVSYYVENIVDFWDIPSKSRKASYLIADILPELGGIAEIRTCAALIDDDAILVPVKDTRDEHIHDIHVIAFTMNDSTCKGKLFSTKNPYYNHNSGFEYLSNGLLFLKGSTENTSGVVVFDAKTGSLVQDVSFQE